MRDGRTRDGAVNFERIFGPDPIPEFRDCERCGIELKDKNVTDICVDCKGLNAYRGNPRQIRNNGTDFSAVEPAYEVSLHYPKIQYNCPTQATLDALQVPYFSYYATEDPVAVNWAKNLPNLGGDKGEWPIVLITSHGEVLDWWTGFDLHQLNLIPAARAAATQMSQTPHGFESVTIEQEQAA